MDPKTSYGYLEFNLQIILDEKNISKNQVCKDLDIPRHNLNRYTQQKFQRLDATLICKLCDYLECDISELITYHKEQPKPKDIYST